MEWEAVQISSLKGDQISAQGFSPGFRRGMDTPLQSSSSSSSFSIFERCWQSARFPRPKKSRTRTTTRTTTIGGVPYTALNTYWFKPWAQLFCPFGAETLCLCLMLTRMGAA